VLPVVVPILPIETLVRYQNFIGIRPPSEENHKLTELSQFYADMFGWEDKAKVVAKVYHALSPEDQAACVFFGDNYGRSGAIDYYRSKYGLPPAIGRHNSYWLWGPGKSNGDLILILGGGLEDKKPLFESVDVVDSVYTKYAIPYENNLRVYVCRKVKVPLPELWKKIRVYN
jgi:hypothetical protein